MNAAAAKPRFRVALQGFSEFERSALASYFRLAGDRFPAYEQTESMADARFVVADADHPGVVQLLTEAHRIPDAVFIGAHAPDGALAWMMRPIDPMHVLRELDAAVAMHQARAPRAVAAPAAGSGASQSQASAPPQGQAQQRPSAQVLANAPVLLDPPALSAPPQARRASDVPLPERNVSPEVLIVDDDEPAVRQLERQLQLLGLSAARANTSDKALELMARLDFRFVFIDVELGPGSELDGLNLCHAIKTQKVPPGSELPAVFLTSQRGEQVNRVRGTLARCDAYLDKPVDDASLRRLLAAHGARLARQGPMRALQR